MSIIVATNSLIHAVLHDDDGHRRPPLYSANVGQGFSCVTQIKCCLRLCSERFRKVRSFSTSNIVKMWCQIGCQTCGLLGTFEKTGTSKQAFLVVNQAIWDLSNEKQVYKIESFVPKIIQKTTFKYMSLHFRCK